MRELRGGSGWRGKTWQDVVELFSETQPDVEGALYRAYQWRQGRAIEARGERHRWRDAVIRARRAMRVPVIIRPIGRSPALEAAAQRISKLARRALRRKKIAALATDRYRARAETSPARLSHVASRRG